MKERRTAGSEKGRQQSGQPGGGKGQTEEVRGSGIYPVSGPLPPGPAELKTEAELGHPQGSASAPGSRAVMVRRTTERGRTTATARTPAKRGATRRKLARAITQTPHEIAHEEWEDFLDDFSVEHEGWTTDIEVLDPERVSRLEAHDLPLVGVSIDLEPDEPTASVIAGEELSDHLTHMLPRTTRITALNENELEFEAADRSRTVVRCHEPQK